MTHQDASTHFALSPLALAVDAAIRLIPPSWPLASSVAVNPFLGQTGDTLAQTGSRLARAGGIAVTMPRQWYADQIAAGTIADRHLQAALEASSHAGKPASIARLREAVLQDGASLSPPVTIATLAAEASGIDWPAIIADRFGTWAAGYFDRGQALWPVLRGRSAWAAWRSFATHDLAPEILGLKGFARRVAEAPQDPLAAIEQAVTMLGIEPEEVEIYFHTLLLSLGGWAQFARYELWQAELAGKHDATLSDLLAVRLQWEVALLEQYDPGLAGPWAAARKRLRQPHETDPELVIDEILQEAAERSAQERLAATLAQGPAAPSEGRPSLQAAFCIDVRSEVFRRALEALDPSIRTIGFAGFFGLATEHRGFASDEKERRLPVLLNPRVTSSTADPALEAQDLAARYRARAKRAWGRFKLAAVSSFAFVEATGPVYLGKLVRDALGLNANKVPGGPTPRFDPSLPLDARIDAAATVLRAMSLTSGFAPVVVLAGHGANVVNNPHASGLHCGACGGYSGEVNARLLAGLLNDPAVRAGIAERGIAIPADTVFVAALHDTTTDRVTLYDSDGVTGLEEVRRWLDEAGRQCRMERALRLPRATSADDIPARSVNWAEVRPEWALAGCQAFVAAPRHRTSGRSLAGKAFLHDYDWRKDEAHSFEVLELILIAPVVVASWISLQYYGSCVAPAAFGSGNKLLHNVVGGIGVVEGNGGNLRAGLAWQSVHDGESFAHEPLRLTVCVEAPTEAMSAILARHPQVRALFDNRWLHLVALDGEGRMAQRYSGDLAWEAFA
ncbi:DUF2309 domain-containing protein [Erythrobacter sp. SDW2]|uniref:YbcC family protein n=1 Tax=Erythrobacter sp. SDW2 TaxID=2907154 RepID=UPI001F2E1F07|nr:DUF2309 domain-containing protein [Erythrobacter sp. SDW2]UIP06766.1 DUF2309 domain-containing protein [Erythrobacter sp. SDW2]